MERNVNADIVQARHFQLVDETNRVRAQWGTGPDGSAGLDFYHHDGETPRVSVGVNPYGTSAVILYDDAGRIRARLAVEPSGAPTTFNIRDAENRIRAQILLQDDGAVGFTLTNPAGEALASIQVHPDDLSFVGMYDRHGNPTSGLTNERAEVSVDLNSDTFAFSDSEEIAERLRSQTELWFKSEVAAYASVAGEPPPPDVFIHILRDVLPLTPIYINILSSALYDLLKAARSRQGRADSEGVFEAWATDNNGEPVARARVVTNDPEVIKDLFREVNESAPRSDND